MQVYNIKKKIKKYGSDCIKLKVTIYYDYMISYNTENKLHMIKEKKKFNNKII